MWGVMLDMNGIIFYDSKLNDYFVLARDWDGRCAGKTLITKRSLEGY